MTINQEWTERMTKMQQVADRVGGEVIHTGGNIYNVRVTDPAFGRQRFSFGMEPSDVVGFDRDIDGEYADSGELRVSSEADPEAIAAEIKALLERGQAYHS